MTLKNIFTLAIVAFLFTMCENSQKLKKVFAIKVSNGSVETHSIIQNNKIFVAPNDISGRPEYIKIFDLNGNVIFKTKKHSDHVVIFDSLLLINQDDTLWSIDPKTEAEKMICTKVINFSCNDSELTIICKDGILVFNKEYSLVHQQKINSNWSYVYQDSNSILWKSDSLLILTNNKGEVFGNNNESERPYKILSNGLNIFLIYSKASDDDSLDADKYYRVSIVNKKTGQFLTLQSSFENPEGMNLLGDQLYYYVGGSQFLVKYDIKKKLEIWRYKNQCIDGYFAPDFGVEKNRFPFFIKGDTIWGVNYCVGNSTFVTLNNKNGQEILSSPIGIEVIHVLDINENDFTIYGKDSVSKYKYK